jgi:hypothetical protein
MCGKQLGLSDIALFAPEVGEFLLQVQVRVRTTTSIFSLDDFSGVVFNFILKSQSFL